MSLTDKLGFGFSTNIGMMSFDIKDKYQIEASIKPIIGNENPILVSLSEYKLYKDNLHQSLAKLRNSISSDCNIVVSPMVLEHIKKYLDLCFELETP